MNYFCNKCLNDPTVSKTVGINPMTIVTKCLHCGTLINTAQNGMTLEQRVARLESILLNTNAEYKLTTPQTVTGW